MYYYASIEFAVNITRNHQGKPGAGLTWGEYPNAESCDITAAPGVASVVTNRNTCSYINRHPREKLGSLPEIAEEKCPSFGRSYLFVRNINTSRCQTRSKGVDNDLRYSIFSWLVPFVTHSHEKSSFDKKKIIIIKTPTTCVLANT